MSRRFPVTVATLHISYLNVYEYDKKTVRSNTNYYNQQ